MSIPTVTEGRKWLLLILLLVLSYFPLFMRLTVEPINSWDESLFALRAYKLASTGQLLFNFNEFDHGPDHSNGKPPFFTAIQALSFKTIGYNELALRLPIALASLATVLLIMYFMQREFNNSYLGFLAAAIPLCSGGYIARHAARTGDQDAALALILLGAAISFYWYLKTDRKKYLWAFTVLLIIGVLTKNVAALMFGPGMVLYVLYKRKLVFLLTQPVVYGAALVFGASISGYYLFMEYLHPGFWQHVWAHEMGGRYATVIHGHKAPATFYLDNLAQGHFTPWIYLLVPAFVLVFLNRFRQYRDVLVLFILISLSQLLVLSSASTKLIWYAVPLYPWLAIVAAIMVWVLWEGFSRAYLKKGLVAMVVGVAFFAALYGPGYANSLKTAYKDEVSIDAEVLGGLMKRLHEQHPDIKTYKVLQSQWEFPVLFYSTAYNEQYGYDIEMLRTLDELQVGDTVGCCQPDILNQMRQRFEAEEVLWYRDCPLMKLVSEQPQLPSPDTTAVSVEPVTLSIR